jgi:hypothetical protein
MVPSEAYVGIQRFAILLVIVFLGVPAGAQQGASRPDPFAALRFLAGTWRGDQAGQPGRGAAERTYQFILNDRFLQETNTSTYPPQEKNKKGEIHHHMSMISYDTARAHSTHRDQSIHAIVITGTTAS